MPRRNPRIEGLAAAIPGLLDFMHESSGLSLADMHRALAVHLEATAYDNLRRQWLRWSRGQTVPGRQQLYSIVWAARLRGWLAGLERASVDIQYLISVLVEEAEKSRDARVEKARGAMVKEAANLARGLVLMVKASSQPADVALLAALKEVLSDVGDLLRDEAGPNDSLSALDLADVLERQAGAFIAEPVRQIAAELRAHEIQLAREALVAPPDEGGHDEPLFARPKRLRRRPGS